MFTPQKRKVNISSMKMRTSRKAGFTLVEIMIVVAIIGLLAAIAIPNFVRARQTSQTNACINNLRQIDGAKQQWALENGKQQGDTPQWAGASDIAVQPYLGRGNAGSLDTMYCPLTPPVGGAINDPANSYNIQNVGTPPDCKKVAVATHNAVLR